MRQSENRGTQTQTEEARRRIRVLNYIFIINLLLSVSGFWQLYTQFQSLQAACSITGWLLYFSISIDCLMASTLFIFIAAKNSYNTQNYFLFVLISNIQIVCRFVYLNEMIFGYMDYWKGKTHQCWEENGAWQIGKTIVQILVYFLVSRITGLFIKQQIVVKLSRNLGFVHKKSKVFARS